MLFLPKTNVRHSTVDVEAAGNQGRKGGYTPDMISQDISAPDLRSVVRLHNPTLT